MLTEQYHRDGFYCPIGVMSEGRAAALRGEFERCETFFKEHPEYGSMGAYPHFFMPWLDELIRDEALLTPVRSLLGDDLLVWGVSFFIKEARTTSYVSWHQDLHYWGLDDVYETTAWIALSPASKASGCMRFVPGTHLTGDREHADSFAEGNLLSRGQALLVRVDESKAVDAELEPGQMSLHHGRTFHASNPNTTGERRIGVAIRYIPASIAQADGTRTMASLVSGDDRYGHFLLAPRPNSFAAPADIARGREAEKLKESILYQSAAQRGRRHHAAA
ncbi:MAG: phytanoyl-CoA dioxygenase family protein [Gammaproteobacteria bacterium]|nr:phytanoyl-CoA dioxygenase family protein [Gammaproteobacteria bacterium]